MEEKRKRSRNAAKDRPIFRQKVDKHGKPIYPKQDTRKDYLIIDGYNIIFDWEELRELMDRDINAARGRLLDIISNYQGYTGKKITIVFDAYKTDRTPETMMKYDHLDIVFTQKDQTADAYIERTVHEQGSRYHITVATSDALEQLTVMRLGALRMSAGMLKEEIDRVTKG
jgi:ribosomal protection tetracycline resistance protein